MSEDQEKFEILTGKEMREKYYSSSEIPPVITLTPTMVPSNLWSLIPFAEKWGISDDILRADFVSSVSSVELKELQIIVDKHRQDINQWLAGPEADMPPFSSEYLAFTHMLMAADRY